MSVDAAPEVAPVALDPSHLTHIVHAPGGTAEAVVLEARVHGLPVTALCGWTWVPSRDPQRHPLCEQCVAIRRGDDLGGAR